MVKKFKEVFGKTAAVIQEYPMVLAMAFIGAVSMMFYVNNEFVNREYFFFYLKFALVAFLGISLNFSLKMLAQRIGKEVFLQISGIIFLVIFYFLLPPSEKQFTEVYAFLLIPTFLLSHLFVSFIPFIKEKNEQNFWQYNKNLFINFFLTIVFTGILTGGIMLAILAVDKLFDFNFNGRYYSYTFTFLSTFGSCLIFLLFNEKGLSYLEKNSEYPVILKFFTQYILIPLLLIYAIILYFYSAKILINWELPRGWVSYLILAYSIVGILALLLVHPLKENSSKSWDKIFSEIFYYTLAPLIILLFTAIFTRILEYGYTEPRYFVLILSIWLTTVVLYFIFIRKQSIKFVPISLFIFGLFSLALPYLNTFSVTKRSQKNELMKILSQKNILEDGKINFNKEIASAVADDIDNKFNFLAKRKETDFLSNLLPEDVKKTFNKDLASNKIYSFASIRDEFKSVTEVNKANNINYHSVRISSKAFSADISNYRQLYKVDYNHNTTFKFENNTFQLDSPGKILTSEFNLALNGEKINLLPDLKKLFDNAPKDGKQLVDEIFITKVIGKYEIKMMFDSVSLNTSPNKSEDYIITSESIILLIR